MSKTFRQRPLDAIARTLKAELHGISRLELYDIGDGIVRLIFEPTLLAQEEVAPGDVEQWARTKVLVMVDRAVKTS